MPQSMLSPISLQPVDQIVRRKRPLKRIVDLVGALALLLVLSPVLIVVALLVGCADGCPVIYRRRVLGMDGEFDAYKFRTMRKDADSILASDAKLRAEFERQFKLKNDPRVTKVGKLLRKCGIDEVPQLFNVVKGQMSLVGPRMISPAELGRYGQYKHLLLSVRPGLTGYWQVSGGQTVDYNERVKMDIYYINEWSLLMDFKIMVKTPYTLLRRDRAY